MASSRRPGNAQAQRNARARELGFASDYDRRVRGGASATPTTPKATGEELAALRGHGLEHTQSVLRALYKQNEHGVEAGYGGTGRVEGNLGDLRKNANGNYEQVVLNIQTPEGVQYRIVLRNADRWGVIQNILDSLDFLDIEWAENYDPHKL